MRTTPDDGVLRIKVNIDVASRGEVADGGPKIAPLKGWIHDPTAPQDAFKLTMTSRGDRAGGLRA